MPYRVRIDHPNFRDPFYWPGHGEEPADLSKTEAERVVEDMQQLDANLSAAAGRRGEQWEARQYRLDWVKAERRRAARR